MAPADEKLIFEPLLERDGVQVSKSPWGSDDEIGRMNWMTAESKKTLLDHLNGAHLFDLSVDYFLGMPAWTLAGDPPYQCWMTHTPEGTMNDHLSGMSTETHEKYSYCGDSVLMYIHTGTHMDLLNHLGFYDLFWNGMSPEKDLGSRHWMKGGADKYPPIVARGTLLDIAGLHGVDCLPESYAITPEDLKSAARRQRIEVRRGDVVHVRTGQMTKWLHSDAYLQNSPGLSLAGAKYLAEEVGAMCVAADTIGVEVLPSEDPEAYLPVHCYMFATAGCQILENVDMEEIAAEKQYQFAFIAFPLKFQGLTGAPMRPIAVPLRN